MKIKLYFFLGIAFISLTFMLGSWGLTESSEARYATIAKEMNVSNDFINPTLLGIKHFHKPPVTYYLTTLGYKLFGTNEFGARFFLEIALLIQILLVFKITLLLYKNEKIAFAASLIYFSFPITVIASRNLTSDCYLTTFILASIYSWLNYQQQLKPYLVYLFYLFLGFIFETKGPVGLIVPLTFIITHKVITKNKIELSIHQFFGCVLFLIVSLAWYVVVINKNEDLFHYFINRQLIERVSQNSFNRAKPFWYYVLIMPLVGIPWLFLLIFYFKKNINAIVRQKKIEFVLLITFLVLFIMLSFSISKLILYVLPLYSILAIFSARHLSEITHTAVQNISNLYIGLISVYASCIVLLPFIKTDFDINIMYVLLIFIVSGILTFVLNKNILSTNYLKPAYFGVVFMISIIVSANHIFKENELKINSVKPIAEFILNNAEAKSEVIVYNYLLPSLSFYLNQEITTINHGKNTLQRETQFESNTNWQENLINYFDTQDRARILKISTGSPVFLIKRKKDVSPDTLLILQNSLKHKKEFDKFEVYY